MNVTRHPRQAGFTVIELLFAAIVLIVAGFLVFSQINSIRTANDDSKRKVAINAMHFALEEVYYKKHQSYPAKLDSAALPSVDPELFTDPDGFTLGKDALTEDELQKLIEKGDTSTDFEKRLASISSGKQPNYRYDAKDCNAEGSCKGYTLRADMQNEAEYVKKNRPH